MEEIIISADGDSVVYSVPDDVANHLRKYCIEFFDKWMKTSPYAKCYRIKGGYCYNEADFIDYLNERIFPEQKSVVVLHPGEVPVMRLNRTGSKLWSAVLCGVLSLIVDFVLLPHVFTLITALGCPIPDPIWISAMILLPVVIAIHLLERDTELACDEAALKLLPAEEHKAYGTTILDAVERLKAAK